jgi:hypothetical protein
VGGVTIRLRQAHREIDGGMIRHIEKKDLRGAKKERGFDARRLWRRPMIEKQAEQMAQYAEAAQHGRDQRARQRAVAIGKRAKPGMGSAAVELLIERTMPPQHGIEDIGRKAAHGKTRHLIGGARTSRSPRCALHDEKFLLRGRHGYANSAKMPTDPTTAVPPAGAAAPQPDGGPRPLPPAAQRDLAEAAARRAARHRNPAEAPEEVGGRGGLDPTRYGDWEIGGLAVDF